MRAEVCLHHPPSGRRRDFPCGNELGGLTFSWVFDVCSLWIFEMWCGGRFFHSVCQILVLFHAQILLFSISVMSDSFVTPWTVAHQAPCPWDFPGKNTGVGCHFLLQGILPTQGSNPHLLSMCHLVLTFHAFLRIIDRHLVPRIWFFSLITNVSE